MLHMCYMSLKDVAIDRGFGFGGYTSVVLKVEQPASSRLHALPYIQHIATMHCSATKMKKLLLVCRV